MDARGTVRQVDVFTEGFKSYQVILTTSSGGELVATTNDARAQAILLASLATSKPVVVEYKAGTPNELTRVTLSA